MKSYLTKKEIIDDLKLKWNLPKPTDEEIKYWNRFFKRELTISLSFLIGKKICNKIFKEDKSIIVKIVLEKTGIRILDNKNELHKISNSIVETYNPFTKKIELIPLFFRDKCVNFLSDGYYIDQKDLKKIYYVTDEYKKKYKKTLKEKYNVENIMEIPGHQEKIKKTMKEKYGVDWFLQRGHHYKAIDDKMLEKYGTTVPIKNNKIKNKIKATIKERYGVDWFLRRGKHYEKIDKIMIDKYGVKNIFYRTGEYFEIIRGNGYSKIECEFIEKIIEEFKFKNSISIISSGNQKILKRDKYNYIVDFYNEEKNVIIEFYGDFWHCNPEIYDKNFYNPKIKKYASQIWECDTKRKQEIIQVSGCKFIEIWEKDWKEKPVETINFIKTILESE
jgi:hypothetical protein